MWVEVVGTMLYVLIEFEVLVVWVFVVFECVESCFVGRIYEVVVFE